MIVRSHSLNMIAVLAVVVMTMAGLASCGGGGGTSRSVSGSGGDEMTIKPPKQGNPDLSHSVVAILGGPSGFALGGYFVMLAVIQNFGDGASVASTLRYYRSTDPTITTSDTELGRDTVPGLAASEFSLHELDVTLPSSPGTYYYGVCVDAVTGESDTTNNCSRGGRVVVPSAPPQKSVEVTPREVTLTALGDTAALTARVLDAQGDEIPGEAVSWHSLNPDVATVDAAGVVTAVANGIAGVTASASGVSGLARVIVALRSALQGEGSPDLIIDGLTVFISPGAFQGGPFSLTATVRNDGDGASAASTLR